MLYRFALYCGRAVYLGARFLFRGYGVNYYRDACALGLLALDCVAAYYSLVQSQGGLLAKVWDCLGAWGAGRNTTAALACITW